jgi:DNA-binding IclR family transcriptional regulator
MAERAGVSRGTVRNFLVTAREQGWIAPAGEHAWLLLPAFHAELMQWMGREFLWMHTLACAAWDAGASAPG